jgi:hypothetical protein
MKGKRRNRIGFPKMKCVIDTSHESDDEYKGEYWSVDEVCPYYHISVFSNFTLDCLLCLICGNSWQMWAKAKQLRANIKRSIREGKCTKYVNY